VPEALVYRVSGCSVDGDAAKPTPRPDRDINTNPEAFTVSELQRAENAVKVRALPRGDRTPTLAWRT